MSEHPPSLIERQRAAYEQARIRRPRWPLVLVLALTTLLIAIGIGNDLAIAVENDLPSRSIGTPEQGRLENGKRLPSRGRNFRPYSDLGTLLGRNAVHDAVRRTVVAAYAALEASHPEARFVYGETGWPSGGPFPPHKTHQNGMAVDFFVPVRDVAGNARFLPTSPFNKFGYSIEFDNEGRWDDYRIDFDALAAHLDTLALAARSNGLRIEVVIFDTALQAPLFASTAGRGLAQRVRFSKVRPWIRHDEHYHVVFAEDVNARASEPPPR